jgi:NAD(P)-dependent dehydrogenase (short-subunit alcohol dehydrogenase family)
VILACRDPRKAERAAEQIAAEAPQVTLRLAQLDLASLASVRRAAGDIRSLSTRLDLLINNAGVMDIPYQRSEDGFELTLATNHLGHFALTGLLLDRLLATPASRIVTVSSLAHRRGTIRFDDPQLERHYKPMTAYDQSKLANLLFSYELQARLAAAGAATIALAAYPGDVRTNLYRTSSLLERVLLSPRLRALTSWEVQDPDMGALPTLRAATDPMARGGECYGPAGRFDTGYPIRVESSSGSHDTSVQRQLWQVSQQLTGVCYAIDALSSASPHLTTAGGASERETT